LSDDILDNPCVILTASLPQSSAFLFFPPSHQLQLSGNRKITTRQNATFFNQPASHHTHSKLVVETAAEYEDDYSYP